MKRKSPFTDWVFEAWDELVLAKGMKLTLAERRKGWAALYEKTFVNGAWTVGVEDAAMVASLGDDIAMTSGQFERARDLLREFFRHPDLTRELLIRHHHDLFIREAIADILCGNVDASDRLRAEIHRPGREKIFLNVVRNDLRNLLNEMGPEKSVEPKIREFVAEVIAYYRGAKRLSQQAKRSEANADLLGALEGTYGR